MDRDTGGDNDSGMVPVLDLQVWIRHPGAEEDGLGSDLLAWQFNEKKSAFKKVL